MEHGVEGHRPERPEYEHERHDEAEVADPVDDERLLAGLGGDLLGPPEADQQVGAKPDHLPPEEDHCEVVGEHQGEHRGGEEVEVHEVPALAGVAVDVPDGVEVDE